MSELQNPLSDGRSLNELTKEELLQLVEAQQAGIRIQFPGKDVARQLARRVRPRVSRTLHKYTTGDSEAQARNTVIEGDNLQAMVSLYQYRAQADLILTDPPYNTGNDWRYNDRWDSDPNDPGLGDWVGPEDVGRHTKWMKFMYPRLQMMRAMLKPAGVLAICIDQRELFRLGQMLDELFGERNRLGIINWQRTYSRTNDATHLATTTEYVLAYAKDQENAHTALLPRQDAAGPKSNPDRDPKPWSDHPATGSNAMAHKTMVYGIQNPFTGDVLYPPSGSAWRLEQSRNLEYLRDWGCSYELRDIHDSGTRAAVTGIPKEDVPQVPAIMLAESLESARQKAEDVLENGVWPRLFFLKNGRGRPRRKKYPEELQQGIVPTTYWADEDFDEPQEVGPVSWPHKVSGHSQQGVDELTAIVGHTHGFKTVKPLKLFSRIIEIWCPPDGLVVDPFAGSGTSGHAVLALNQATGTARRFILIEQGQPNRGDSYARTLMADRLQRVVSGEWASGDSSPLGGGFRFVQLQKKVDADTVLRMERDEMLDTVINSHRDSSPHRGTSLVSLSGKGYRYLIAKNVDNEGFFLIWDGPDKNTDFTEDVYEQIAEEAGEAGLAPTYHVYARLYVFQTENVRFYQIPDQILADFGLDLASEPFSENIT